MRFRNGPCAAAAQDLVVTALSKSFGRYRAVDAVDLRLSANEVKAVIGPNGAGKSTLFSCIAGTIKPTSGTVSLGAIHLGGMPSSRLVRHGLIKTFQTTSIFPAETVWTNLMLAAVPRLPFSLRNAYRRPAAQPELLEIVEDSLREVGLLAKRHSVSGTLPHGEQRKLEIAIAIARGARVLLMDEPTAGMGAEDIAAFRNLVERLRLRCSILIVEHNMEIVLGISDSVVVMSAGRVLVEGTPAEIKADADVRAVYLGRRPVPC